MWGEWARRTADDLDLTVNAQIGGITRVPPEQRAALVELLAVLVTSAHDHRLYARGWIRRRELRRRQLAANDQLRALSVTLGVTVDADAPR